MRWEDERYVRLYTTDDGDWVVWPWQARALFPLLLRRADRVGVVKVGKHGARGLAEMVRLPLDVVEPGLAALLEDGCVTQPAPGALFVRNYLRAQEATQSDAARKRAQRERERAALEASAIGVQAETVTNRDTQSQDVTVSHDTGRNVTTSHEQSQSVTGCHSMPSRAVLCRADDHIAQPAAQAAQGSRERQPEFDFDAVYAAYPRKLGKTRGLKTCKAQIRTAADYDALRRAVDRYAAECRGKDPEFVKHFSTFMSCWRDYATPADDRPDDTARAAQAILDDHLVREERAAQRRLELLAGGFIRSSEDEVRHAIHEMFPHVPSPAEEAARRAAAGEGEPE